jgi:dihydroorotate dehydrogenase (NAD+) catalytic subunit
LKKLEVELFGIIFQNPVMVASGTYGYGEEASDLQDISELGGLVTKTVTPEPRAGNPPPRTVETVGGLLNSIGLANVGVEEFASSKWSWISANRGETRVIVNIGGRSLEDFALMAKKISSLEGVDALEINLSCPNVEEGGAKDFARAGDIRNVVEVVKDNSDLPIISKLSPNNMFGIEDMALEAVDAGSSGISLINTLMGMEIDIESRRAVLGNVTGGLSGPAILPVGLCAVKKVADVVEIPVIGIGGISNTTDALKYIIAGASAVQVGTANFVNPIVCREIIQGLEQYISEKGLQSISTLIGSLKT